MAYPNLALSGVWADVAIYGYARVSTDDQDTAIQVAALKAAGCSVVREEKKSGTSRNGRTELETLLAFMREGDVLMVTRIDRLARSMKDLQDIVHELKQKGVFLKATEQPIDTSSAAGPCRSHRDYFRSEKLSFRTLLEFFSRFTTRQPSIGRALPNITRSLAITLLHHPGRSTRFKPSSKHQASRL
jgi:DNA invertase Pin-like site-specific DNA recombinase